MNASISADGWEKENLNFTYSYHSKRDHSPVNNDFWRHSYRAVFSSRRVRDLLVRGSAAYLTQEDSLEARNYILSTEPGANQKRRTVTYDVNAEYVLSVYAAASAGASRGQATTTYQSLSGILPPSSSQVDDSLIFGSLTFTYPLARFLVYRAQLREEHRRSAAGDIQSHQVNMNLDYRIRSLFLNFEYRWRLDDPETGQNAEQQYVLAKLTRPF